MQIHTTDQQPEEGANASAQAERRRSDARSSGDGHPRRRRSDNTIGRSHTLEPRASADMPRALLFGLDLVLVAASLTVGVLTWVRVLDGTADEARQYILFAVASLPFWLVVFCWQKLYRHWSQARFIEDARRVVSAIGVGAMVFVLLG